MELSGRTLAASDAIEPVTSFYLSLRAMDGQPDVVDLTFGDPHEMPLPALVDAMRANLEPRAEDWFAYKSSLAPAQEAIAAGLRDELGLPFEAADITMTQGAFGAIALALRLVADAGDEMVIPAPGWFYAPMLRAADMVPVQASLTEGTLDLDVAAIEQAITPRTRVVVVNSPANPLRTGLATFTASGSSKHVKILCRRRRTSCSTVCQSIANQSVGSSSGPFNTATPDNDADAAAEGVVVVMLSNLSFGSGFIVPVMVCTPVTEELVNAFKRVTGKENILFKLAEASLSAPEGTVREVVFPAVAGGEQTLRELVHEFKTKGPTYRRTVQTTLKASYTNHYRRGLIRLLDVLEFRSSNTAHQPVIAALALIAQHANADHTTYYPLGDTVPAHRGVAGDWDDVVYRIDTRGRRRVVRMAYEVATFQALREALRCKEIWTVGADRWRNPDQDLPADFEQHRTEHYRELRKPVDPTEFITQVREQLRTELAALNSELPSLSWLSISERRAGAIKLTAADAQPEPRNLRRIKAEVLRRWGTVPLVDMLKEAVLRTGCLNMLTSVSGGGSIRAEMLAERLLLAIYAYGTNTGIKAVAAGGHGHSEDDIRYVRRRYLSLEAARAIAVQIADATFAVRQTSLWGIGSSAVASDSTHVRAYDQNLFTEWHSRYGGRGVLIYWHVERKPMIVHSQLISCTASEVAAMTEGAMRHGTTMDVEGNYVDSHGQSEIGFGITKLLGFDLLPRIKQINRVKLYRPAAGEPDAYTNLAPALTRPIRWELIAQQYDQLIKYATAIRTGTATTEAILRRFTRNASHPTYAAMLELGRAQKTIFVCRYLRVRDLQREIEEGLNVMESSNRANSVIAYGGGGQIASNRRDEQEMFVKGKSCETFNPLGPWLVTADEVADPQNLSMRLSVNGIQRQSGSTSTMIFGVGEIIRYLSQVMVLYPGDVINTGTPPGVALGQPDPKPYLRDGDVVECEIQGLGVMRQTFRQA